MKRTITVEQLAAYNNVSPRTIHLWLQEDRIIPGAQDYGKVNNHRRSPYVIFPDKYFLEDEKEKQEQEKEI